MQNKELIDGLNSSIKSRVEELTAVQAKGAEAIKKLNEARESGDAGRVSEASTEFETIGAEIKSLQEEIDTVNNQKSLFKTYEIDEDGNEKSADADNTTKMRDLFDSLKNEAKFNQTTRSIGEEFANVLKYRNIASWGDLRDNNGGVKLTALLGKDPGASDLVSGTKSTKSLYANNGAVLLDGSSVDVPGYMGFNCGLVIDPAVTCLIEPPKDDFEECLTQATIAGNRLRFTREVSRNDAAASVLETVYNPYPNFLQDGTKPEGMFTLENVEVTLSKIAEFVTASDEVLEDCPSVAALIDNFLISGINKEKRRQLIAGDASGGSMRGILNQSGLLTRTHQDTLNGGKADDNFYDTFRRALTDLWYQSANTDNVCVIMNPRDAEIIDLTKDDIGHYLFNDADCFNRMLRCLKIRYSVDMPAGTAVMGEFANNWVFYTRRALDIRMGYTGDQFITNTNTILGEMRGMAVVRCPRKIIKISGLA